MLDPGIRPGALPPFHELGAYRFEELCRDLLAAEPEIATCDIYGDPGQTQDGIDLLAQCINGDGIEVGQSKCYSDFPPREIRAASDKFFEYWGHWSRENVKRFVLFVACDLRTRQRQDEIRAQQRRFAQVGIVYEAWSAATIRNKLRPHPGIVANHLSPPDHWVLVICGTSLQISGYGTQPFDTVQVALKNQLDQFAAYISDDKDEDIEHLREAWREGRKEDARNGIIELKSAVVWPFLHSSTKAKLLRFEANVVLQLTGDIARAKELADEAHILAPSDSESILRAMIAYTESGPEAALPILAEQQDLHSRNLKAAFLLQMGRADEGRAFLNVETIGLQPNAETFRLRALVNLQAKAINQAQLDIQKAAELAPRWESIRYTFAVINYFSSLSLAALPNAIVPWPEPVAWPLVKQDDESVERLRTARTVFEDLITEAGQDAEERGRLQAWRLACLANDLEQQDAAVECCQTVLVEDATDFRALSWAVARNFEIDLSNSEFALEALVQANSATVPHVLALAGCYIRSQKADATIQLLDTQKPLFEKAHLLPMWTLWYVQLLVADGQGDLALAYVDQMPAGEAAQLAQIVVLSAQTGQGGDWQRALESIEALHAGTQNPKYLLDSCELAARFGNWEYVADRSEELVESLETEMALKLAVYGTFNTRRFEVCLHLLNRNAKLCHHDKLPADLQRARAFCYQALGILPSAIAELERLAQQDPTLENLAALAQARFDMGDLKGLVIVGRQLSKHRDLAPEIALQIAQSIQLEDLTLAQTLWRKANAQGLSDDLVGVALDLGYRLGLDRDRELRELNVRVGRLGQEGRGGVFMKRIEDIAEMVVQWREHRAQIEQLYLDGKAPIHFVAEQLHLSLVDLYRYRLSVNEIAPNLVNPHLLARHGGRPIPPGFPNQAPEWRLHLDITSLLLANHLDVLDTVERAFAPLRIPAEVIPALIYMRNKIAPHQPSQLEICNQMVRLAEQGVFQVVMADDSDILPDEIARLAEDLGVEWLSLFAQASASGGYLVDFLPLRKQGTSQVLSDLPAAITQRVINCRSILEALRAQGLLSDEDYAQALDRLGDQGHVPPSQEVPGFDVPLYFHANTPDILIGAGIFRDVCAQFQVFIEQREMDQAKATVKGYQQSQEIDRWLESLIARLHQGLESGSYKALPQFVDKERWSKDDRIESPEILCLFSLLRYEAKEGDVIWIDDRFGNSFARRDATPIITIIEVLKGLVGAQELSKAAYYEKLDRLRAANVRFIPIEPDEIQHHLEQAKIKDGVVLETRQLTNLRHYVAACLFQSRILQSPSPPGNMPNPNGEIAFPLNFHHALTQSFIELWQANMGDDVRVARAEWILTNLYIDYLGLRSLSSLPKMDQGNPYFLFTMSLADLLSQAIMFMPSPETATSPRKQYFDWLFGRILGRRLDVDPQLVVAIADILKRLMLSHVQDQDNADIVSMLLQAFYEDLPGPILEELQRDTEFMESIGIKVATAFYLDDLHFSPEDFWRAATAAVNGVEAPITPKGMTESLIFKPAKTCGTDGVFCFRHPKSGATVVVAGDEFKLLCDSPMEREAVLLRNRRWFDCHEAEFRKEVARIASLTDPQQRFETLETWRDASAIIYYETLYHKFSEHEEISFSQLVPPSAEGLLRHFRLSTALEPEAAFCHFLAAASQTLIDEESLPAAIDRLSGLPVPLPQSVIDAIAELSTEDKRTLFKRLLRIAGSPISKFHLIALLLRFDAENPAFSRLAQRIALRLFGEEAKSYLEAYLAILNWTYGVFLQWPETQGWPTRIQLSMTWAHTHRLFSTFLSVGVDCEWIKNTFTSITPFRSAAEVFERVPDLWLDIAHPRNVNPSTLLLDGLCYGFGERLFEFGSITETFAAEFLYDHEGKIVPIRSLWKDVSQAQNTLGAFLGGDCRRRLILSFIQTDKNSSTVASFQDWIARNVAILGETPDAFLAWVILYAVQSDFPPYPELVPQLRSVFSGTDYIALFQKDTHLGYTALQTAAMQCGNLHDENLRQYLRFQALEAARYLSDTAPGKNVVDTKEALALLIEIALNISLAATPPLDVSEEFAQLMLQLADTWKEIVPVCRPIVQALVEDLPIRHAHKLWPLLVWLRAN